MFGMPPYMSVGVRSFPKVKKTFKPRKHEAGGEIDVRKKIPKHRGERKIEEKVKDNSLDSGWDRQTGVPFLLAAMPTL